MTSSIVQNGHEHTESADDWEISIKRRMYDNNRFNQTYCQIEKPKFIQNIKYLAENLRPTKRTPLNILLARFPIILWLYKYKITFLLGDTFSGLTVAIMNISQGMAYALLAKLHPVYGLYSSVLFAIVYSFFGTSRHASLGTFAVVSLLVSDAITELSRGSLDLECATNNTIYGNANFTTTINSNNAFSEINIGKIRIASTLCFLIGCIMSILGLLKFGILSIFLSKPFISSYSTGAAVHVLTSQFDRLFGITSCELRSLTSIFKVPRTWFIVIKNIIALQINWLVIVVSVICIIILYILRYVNLFLQKKKFPMPIPGGLILIIIFTTVSYLAHFKANFDVSVVGEISRGVPVFALPDVNYLAPLFVHAITLSVVIYSTGFSMEKVLAEKAGNYKIDPSQEMFAFGITHFISSFFSCFPGGVSLSRSSVQMSSGGNTQLASIISGLLILLVLVAVGPLLESLPTAVLAALVVVGLHTVLSQVTDIWVYWNQSKYDLITWVATFTSTVAFNVQIGFLVGVGCSLLVVIFRTVISSTMLLGTIQGTEYYARMDEYQAVQELLDIKIIKHANPLYFANSYKLKNYIMHLLPENNTIVNDTSIGCGPYIVDKISNYYRKLINRSQGRQVNAFEMVAVDVNEEIDTPIFSVILDFSCVSFIDSVGANVLYEIHKTFKEKKHNFYMTSMSNSVLNDFLNICKARKYTVQLKDSLFPSIHDAITYIKCPRGQDTAIDDVPLTNNINTAHTTTTTTTTIINDENSDNNNNNNGDDNDNDDND